MNININKMQSGGLLFSAVANPAANSQQGAAATGSSSDKSPEILSKETIKMLTQSGLTNEFNYFSSILAELEKEIDATGTVDRDALARVRSLANQLMQNSSFLEDAIKRATDHEALDDLAIDQNGFIYAMDEHGKVKKTSLRDFNPKKSKALSVSELIEYRRNSPDAIDNSAMIADISNSIGLEKINQFVQDILAKVGTTETKTEAYQNLGTILTAGANKMTQQEYDALKAVAAASDQIGLDAIFKTSELNKNKNVAIACEYLMKILPKNMRMQLQANYVVGGGKAKDSGAYAANLIETAALATNDRTYHYGVDYQQDINTAAGTSTGTAPKDKQRNITALEELTNGSMGRISIDFRDSKNPNNTLTVYGTGKGYLPDVNGNAIPKNIATIALQRSIGPLVDENRMYIGDKKISLADMNSIVYAGGDIANIWAPVDSNGEIDFSALRQFQELEAYFAKNPELTINDRNQYLAQVGIQGYYDASGEFHGNGNMEKFFVFTGITSDEVIDPKKTMFTDVVPSDREDDEMKQIDGIYKAANKAYGDGEEIFEFKKGFFSTDLIKAPVFMKIKRTAYNDASTLTGNGSMVTTPTYADALARDNMSYQAQQGAPVVQPSTGYIFAQ